MELQLALDFVNMDEAIALMELMGTSVDIIEAGTPLLLREGTEVLRRLRARNPKIRILADAKIVDGGYAEAKMLFDAGADIVTVLAVASSETLAAVQSAANECAGIVAADMIASSQPLDDLAKVAAAGIQIACVHRATDRGSWGTENSRLLEQVASAARSAGNLRIMVAGGLSLGTIPSVRSLSPDIVVVGGAIVSAADPAKAAREIRDALQ